MRAFKLCCVATSVALVAAAFSAAASADSVCKVKEAPCSLANSWPSGTTFESKIKTGTQFKFDGFRHYTCTESTRSDRLMFTNTAKGLPMTLEPKSETYTGCTSVELGACTAVTGSMQSVKWLADTTGTWNGFTNATSIVTSITLNCTGLNCKWLFLEQISHTYQGGNPAIETVKARLARSGESNMFCGTEVVMEGQREITSPSTSPIYWSYG